MITTAAAEAPRPVPFDPNAAKARLTSINYLIVDHVPYRARLSKGEMKAMGMRQVDVCNDPALALQMLDTSVYDAAVIAFDLPNTSGPKLTQSIRAKSDPMRRQIPVVMISSDSSIQALREAVNAGIHELVISPFSANDLMTRIQRAVITPRTFVVSATYVGPDRRPKDRPSPFSQVA